MKTKARESHRRSVTKAISWRILGSLDTMLLAYLFTGNMVIAGSIATTESVTKIVLYYLHERAWAGFSMTKLKSLFRDGATRSASAPVRGDGEALLPTGNAA